MLSKEFNNTLQLDYIYSGVYICQADFIHCDSDRYAAQVDACILLLRRAVRFNSGPVHGGPEWFCLVRDGTTGDITELCTRLVALIVHVKFGGKHSKQLWYNTNGKYCRERCLNIQLLTKYILELSENTL